MSAALRIAIVCPASAAANNGNWRTAARWQRLLQSDARVRIVPHWPDAQSAQDEVLLALHARKSAPAIAAWHARHGARGLGVVLTGTDLYPDITRDALAMRSLQQAAGLVVLQVQALQALPAACRDKARVIFQSCEQRQTLHKTARHLRVVMVGHLRDEKNPQMLWRAVRAIAPGAGILVDHIGDALAPALAGQAQATAAACPHYRWLRGLSHAATLQRIQRAHLLVHTSRSEGGAIVISEALRCGTPVLATRIPGNAGLLGEDYAGLVEPDDDGALAARLQQCRQEQAMGGAGLLQHWQAQCAARAGLFEPARERAALQDWVSTLRG
ncbi:MAG: selenoneine biosynthesis selenosugar synthase SenB [Limnohabitans sp.]